MAKVLTPLSPKVPIVDEDGNPTPYFQRVMQELADARISASLADALGGDPGSNQIVTWDESINSLDFKSLSDVLDFVGSAAHGDILYRGQSAWNRLPADTDGKVLTTHSAGANPTWETPAAATGDLVLISEQSPSGTGVITFSSIPSTYRDLRVVIRGRGTTAATSVAVNMTFNNDTGANYDFERVSGTGTSASANGVLAQNNLSITSLAAANSSANVADACRIDIFDYRGTTFQKICHAHQSTKRGTASNADLEVTMRCGWWRSTSAITEIDLTLAAGNYTTGSVVSLYGIM